MCLAEYNQVAEAFTPDRADEPFDVCVANSDLCRKISNSPHTRSANFKRLAANYIGRWDAVQLHCSNFMSCTLAERLALLLLELSEHFGVRHAQGMQLTVKARHKDLAELLGASRPRVSEHLKELDHKGFIVRKNRQLIVKRDRLERCLLQTPSSYRHSEAHEAGSPTDRAGGSLSN